jgi:hypothetical protein
MINSKKFTLERKVAMKSSQILNKLMEKLKIHVSGIEANLAVKILSEIVTLT